MKSIIISILIIYDDAKQIKFIIIIMIALFYMLLNIKIKPYNKSEFNKLDFYSHLMIILTILFGLLLKVSNIEWHKTMSYVNIIIINAFFIIKLLRTYLSNITIPYNIKQRNSFQKIIHYLIITFPYFFYGIYVQK